MSLSHLVFVPIKFLRACAASKSVLSFSSFHCRGGRESGNLNAAWESRRFFFLKERRRCYRDRWDGRERNSLQVICRCGFDKDSRERRRRRRRRRRKKTKKNKIIFFLFLRAKTRPTFACRESYRVWPQQKKKADWKSKLKSWCLPSSSFNDFFHVSHVQAPPCWNISA